MSTQPTPAAARHCKVAIIGTGFSGLGMAIRLRQEGEDDFLIFEKDAGVGGTWRVNNYPGCAYDVQSHVYSFSF
ncbi:NAD(P)-binding protein, partial [Acinetobacter baumannii]